ncbi:MAG: hypothetical protein M3Q10_02410 [Chloroflexota bacterium]|nr:hypothetical protein [Chloroflexota bacterium]
MQNAERHAAAGCVAVALIRQGDAVVLRVPDDGTGIAADDQARPGRHGIVGMRERAAALGGSLRVDRRPGGGTVVEALLPLSTVTTGVATPSPTFAPAEGGR